MIAVRGLLFSSSEQLNAHNKIIETQLAHQVAQQVSHLSQNSSTRLPSQTVTMEHVNAITSRCGMHYESPKMPKSEVENVIEPKCDILWTKMRKKMKLRD